MNQPTNDLGGVNSMNQLPATPGGLPPLTPAIAASTPIPTTASTPFESSVPDLTGPTGPTPTNEGMGSNMEPMAPKSNAGLFIILIVLVLIGGVVLAVWKGWLNFGNLLGSKTPTPAPSITTPFSPVSVFNKNDSARKADLANLKTALLTYYNDKQSYPVSPVLAKASDPNGILKVLVPTYIVQLPIDPLSPNSYYGYKSDGKSFTLSASLEDQADPSGVPVGNLYLYQVTNTSIETPIVGPDATSSGATTPVNNITFSTSPIPSVTSSANTGSSSDSSSSSSSTNGTASAGASVSANP